MKLEAVLDFEKFDHHAIVQHSTTIEGSTLTKTEVQLLLEEGITAKGKPLIHSLMNIDHLEAMHFVIAAAKEKKGITPTFIQAINAKVMRQTGSIYNPVFGTIDASAGELRKGNVRAGNGYFVGYDKVPGLLEALCQKLQEKLPLTHQPEDQLNLSFDAHLDLVSIHPFYDGNGRTARLLMNFIQQYFGLPLGIVFKEDKAEYFDALIKAREAEDLQIFRNFMHQKYIRFLQDEIIHYEKAQAKPGCKGSFSLVF